jgi:hypothetical protein
MESNGKQVSHTIAQPLDSALSQADNQTASVVFLIFVRIFLKK